MARSKNWVSPEVAQELADLARQMRKLVYGEEGIPAWGTKFTKIESDCLAVGDELARLMMEQSLDGQSEQFPKNSLDTPEETAAITGSAPATVETSAGEVHWHQPQAHLRKARRDFFPSGESAGD